MQFHKVRELLNKGVSLKDINLNVTFYARVSTTSYEQLNSLDNQIDYFKKFIKDNKNWNYVDGYIDEGISGSTVKGRKEFLKMIEDAKEKKFDLIITKEVSRFSRNLLDSIKYTQELMNNDVGVLFQTNGINTYDTNSEFILNMMSSLAQEEVKRLSTRVKWGAENAIKRGRVLGSKTFGYIKKDTKLFIDENESKIVKLIFNIYSKGDIGIDLLALKLYHMGITNKKGNIFDASTIKNIIRNPKYKGYYQGHTTEVVDYKTKRRIKVDNNERVIFKDENIPAIVSEEIWDLANNILNSRSQNGTTNKKKYPYSGLLICKEHNKTFTRSTGSKRSTSVVWACNDYMKYRLKACRSPLLKENELDYIFKTIFDNIFYEEFILDELIDLYKNNKNENRKKSLLQQKEKILNLYLKDVVAEDEIKESLFKINTELDLLDKNSNRKIDNCIKDIFHQKINIGLYIKMFVEKVIVSKIELSRKNIKLEIYLKHIKYNKELNFNLNNNYKVVIN